MTQPDIQDPTVVDTSVPVEQTAPDTTTGNAETTSSEVVTDSVTVDDQKAKEELAQKREDGKLKQVQEEAKAIREQLEKFANYAAEDEGRYREALQKVQGLSSEEAEKVVSDLKAQNPGLWQAGTPQVDIQSAINSHPVIKEAQKLLDRQREELLATFEADKPDIAQSENPELFRKKIANQAIFISGFPEFAGKPEKELLDAAYQMVKVINPQGMQKALEDAELNGMMKANSDNATTSGVPSAQRPDNSSSVQLTALQRRAMNASGNFKDEAEYLEWTKKK